MSQTPRVQNTDNGVVVKIAVLIASYNRKAKTLACLDALFAQDGLDQFEICVFLVDDGSIDGTAEAVRHRYPQVRLLHGDGSLYWGGSMRLAFETALKAGEDFAYYLWLNDDTHLYPDALPRLVATHRDLVGRGKGHAIVVGSTCDPQTGQLSYGGQRLLWPFPWFRAVRPGFHSPLQCTTMEGNCVLIPDAIARQVGNIDTALVHNRGDFDYGLRAAQLGYGIWVAPGLYATCERDAVEWRTPCMPLRQRLAALHESKYALDQKILVARRHYGPLWFLAPLAVYAYIFLSHPFGLLFSQRHTKRCKN